MVGSWNGRRQSMSLKERCIEGPHWPNLDLHPATGDDRMYCKKNQLHVIVLSLGLIIFRQSEDSHSGPSLTTHTPLWSTMDTPYFIATGSLGKADFWPYTSFIGTCLLLQPPSLGILFIRQLGGNRTSPFNYHHTLWCLVHVSVGTTHTIYHYILAAGVYSPKPTEPDTIARFVTCRGVEPPAIIGTFYTLTAR